MTGTRIGVDATSWTNRRGFGRFTRNVVRRLVELDPETAYVLVADDATAAEADLPARAERLVVRLTQRPTEAAAAGSSRGPGDLIRLTRAARHAHLDGFLFPSVYTYFPTPGIPTVLGIHDMIADDHPELTFATRRARALWRIKERAALRAARIVFTVSESSRQRVARRLGLPPERVPVVPEAPDPVFSPRPPGDVEGARAAVGLQPAQPFVLYAGGISPHKSVETLIEAFDAVSRTRANGAALVIVGDLERESYLSSAESMRTLIGERGLGDRVRLPGFVTDDTLASLYTGASIVVNPSLAEGFGLPAVEAAACGAPLLLSDLEAHRETMDGAALFFPPRDSVALAEFMGQILDDPELGEHLGRQARAAVAGRTWDAAAERVRELLAEAVG